MSIFFLYEITTLNLRSYPVPKLTLTNLTSSNEQTKKLFPLYKKIDKGGGVSRHFEEKHDRFLPGNTSENVNIWILWIKATQWKTLTTASNLNNNKDNRRFSSECLSSTATPSTIFKMWWGVLCLTYLWAPTLHDLYLK